ncbi:DMT family transporter [Loktanella sp. F6476L]|uniref:DMT family transporter n=1 Tax=Loktanella sp. F6476L TaxID=2926405 RepID=UPI001FF4889D|nr:DMT family transporter [Loktanella sp. F6476L]
MRDATTPDRIGVGILMMLVVYLLFTMVDTTAKWLIGLGFPALQVAFLRYAGHFAISAGIAATGQTPLRHPKLPLIVLRALLLVVATMLNFIAITYLPLTIISAIAFSVPIIVCLLSVQVLGEQVGPWRWGAILLGFVGVIIVIQPFGVDYHWAALLCVVNAFLLAAYSLLTRYLTQDVETQTLQFYGGLTGTIVIAPMAYAVWEPAKTWPDLAMWGMLGLCAWAGHEILTRAHNIAPANALMPISYSYLIYMMASDILIFALYPDAIEIVGASVIVLAGLIIWKRGR